VCRGDYYLAAVAAARARGTSVAWLSRLLLEIVVARLVTGTKAGDMTAIKILIDRLVLPPRARTATLNLPSLRDGTARLKAAALGAVLDAMAAGQIDPSEAEVIAGLVERTVEAAGNCGGF
jgi:hypothetical protein